MPFSTDYMLITFDSPCVVCILVLYFQKTDACATLSWVAAWELRELWWSRCPSAQEIQLVNEGVQEWIKAQAEAGLAQCMEGLRACLWWYPWGGSRELIASEDFPHPEYCCVWIYWAPASLCPSPGWLPQSTHLSFAYSLSILSLWPSDRRVWDIKLLVQAQLRQPDGINNKGKGGCVLRKQWVVCSLILF